jgi:hypothetical protein
MSEDEGRDPLPEIGYVLLHLDEEDTFVIGPFRTQEDAADRLGNFACDHEVRIVPMLLDLAYTMHDVSAILMRRADARTHQGRLN